MAAVLVFFFLCGGVFFLSWNFPSLIIVSGQAATFRLRLRPLWEHGAISFGNGYQQWATQAKACGYQLVALQPTSCTIC